LQETFEQIIIFAIEKEKEAADLYTRLIGIVKKPNSKTMFQELAAEEEKHKKFFEGLREDQIPVLPLRKVTDLKISDYLVDVEFTTDMEYQDILIMAMKREESAVKLYTDLASRVQEPKMNKLLQFMAQEESKHKLRLETEYDKNVLRED